MSRTIRRKNYDKQGRSHAGSKVAGPYTEVDLIYVDCQCAHCASHFGFGREFIYREPTPQERFRRFKGVFTDSSSMNYRFKGILRVDRKNEQHAHRQRTRQEIHRFARGSLEDVLIGKNTKYQKHYW